MKMKRTVYVLIEEYHSSQLILGVYASQKTAWGDVVLYDQEGKYKVIPFKINYRGFRKNKKGDKK